MNVLITPSYCYICSCKLKKYISLSFLEKHDKHLTKTKTETQFSLAEIAPPPNRISQFLSKCLANLLHAFASLIVSLWMRLVADVTDLLYTNFLCRYEGRHTCGAGQADGAMYILPCHVTRDNTRALKLNSPLWGMFIIS